MCVCVLYFVVQETVTEDWRNGSTGKKHLLCEPGDLSIISGIHVVMEGRDQLRKVVF